MGRAKLPHGWKLMAWLGLAAGIAVSVFGSVAWYSYLEEARGRSILAAAQTIRQVLTTSLERDGDLTRTVAAYVGSSPTPSNRDLEQLLERVGVARSYPGVAGFMYLEKVPPSGLASYVREVSEDPPLGLRPYRPWDYIPSGGGFSYFCLPRLDAVELGSGLGGLRRLVPIAAPFLAPGYNFCATPIRYLLEQAAVSAQPKSATLDGLFALPGGRGLRPPERLEAAARDIPLFQLAVPVWGGLVPKGSAERLETLKGWVLGIFDASNLLVPVIKAEPRSYVSLYYVATGKEPVFTVGGGQRLSGQALVTLHINQAGNWVARVSVAPDTSGAAPWLQAAAVMAAGLVICGLVLALLLILVRSRRRAWQLVEEKTAELRHLALHDPLTGLPNRLMIQSRSHRLAAEARAGGSGITAIFIDLDDFKRVNDSLGHAAGDEVLEIVGARLRSAVREGDVVGRLGGDEFVVITAGYSSFGELRSLLERIESATTDPVVISAAPRLPIRISASIGVAMGSAEDPELLLRDADVALYQAKSAGKGRYVLYEAGMRTAFDHAWLVGQEMVEAWRRGEFFLVYQPIFDLHSGVPIAAEALLRWRHSSRGVLNAEQFIGELVSGELAEEVAVAVVREAVEQARAWDRQGIELSVCINVSPSQLRGDGFARAVREALDRSALPPERLVVEVSEASLVSEPAAMEALRQVGALGVRISIDDFGMGYSSLAHLRGLPVHSVKLDHSLVAASAEARDKDGFLEALVRLGKALGLKVVAEGVEDSLQLDHLRLEGCDLAQGYVFVAPAGAAEIERMIEDAGAVPSSRELPSAG
jgi:diguanylate cyclase (GGDEF)-like protein